MSKCAVLDPNPIVELAKDIRARLAEDKGSWTGRMAYRMYGEGDMLPLSRERVDAMWDAALKLAIEQGPIEFKDED